MTTSNLNPYLRKQLDVLFVALNPPKESNDNGHYFSGRNSRFFRLLSLSGLITNELHRSDADEIVFGSTNINHNGCQFGVVDLVDNCVETNSARVKPNQRHVEKLFTYIRKFQPRFVCVIHSKVRDTLNRHPDFSGRLRPGTCGKLLRKSDSVFVFNYFPNGNNIPDNKKIEIFRTLRDAL